MTGLEIISTGRALASKTVTNYDFEKTLDTSDEWVSSRTGISERRFVDKETNSSLAITAAKQALNDAHISSDDIAVCIVATFSPENLMPSTASCVASSLSLCNNTICFDLNAACTGFIYALNTAYALLAASINKYALVIGSEVISNLMDMTDRSTCVLFGDGAGAVVVKQSKKHPFYFVGGRIQSGDVLTCNAKERMIRMEGPAVFRFAVDIVPKCVDNLLKDANLCMDDISTIVCHQANKRIMEVAAKRLKVDMSKIFMNLQRYGNTSAASIPLALHELGAKKGEKIICVGFGAGLSYGAALITM